MRPFFSATPSLCPQAKCLASHSWCSKGVCGEKGFVCGHWVFMYVCLPVCGGLACTHVCTYPALPHLQNRELGCSSPLGSPHLCNLRVGPQVGTAAPGSGGRGLAGWVSVQSFCGGVTSGVRMGWGGKWRTIIRGEVPNYNPAGCGGQARAN